MMNEPVNKMELSEQNAILQKAKIPHIGLQINALEGIIPEGIRTEQIYKTLALTGDKTGPVIGIVPISAHLSEKKLAKLSGNKKVSMIPQQQAMSTEPIILLAFDKNTTTPFSLTNPPWN